MIRGSPAERLRNRLRSLVRRPERVAAARVAAGEYVRLDMIGSRSECGANCPALIDAWSDWCRSFADGFVDARELRVPGLEPWLESLPEGDQIVVPITPAALLRVPDDFDDYVAAIGAKPRNMLRKAERKGYVYRQFDYNDELDAMFEINTSKPVRSGGPMESRFSARLTPVPPVDTCPRHHTDFVGGYRDDKLYAYCMFVVLNELAAINVILGHADALPDGVMNGLIAELVRQAQATGTVRFINYLRLEPWCPESLARFKRSVGFESTYMVARVAE